MSSAGNGASVRVLPLDVELAIEPGETVFDAAYRQGYTWPTRCVGQAICGMCVLEIINGGENAPAPEGDELAQVKKLKAFRRTDANLRLACRLRVTGPVTVSKDGVKPQG